MAKTIALNVNGKPVTVTIDDPDMPLLYALRDNLALQGPALRLRARRNAAPARCTSTARRCAPASRRCRRSRPAQKVVTLEGLGTRARSRIRVQQAFIDEQAVQCGYCINGMIMESAAFLASNKKPTEAEIKQALANNLCRCGTHARIVRAVKRAASAA